MRLWLIPMVYVGGSVACGLTLPRIEHAYLAVRRYLERLDLAIERSPLDAADRIMARQEDRQGLGLSRRPAEPKSPPPLDSRDEPRAAQA